jgi:[protein-PII] uridylyltransferase
MIVFLSQIENISLEHASELEYKTALRLLYEEFMDRMKHKLSKSGKLSSFRLSYATERLLMKVYNDVLKKHKYNSDAQSLVAVGGFGRRELNPVSDVDILFLQHKKYEKESEEFVSKVLYILWDLKLKLGQSSRSIKNCIKASFEDITFKTSLVSSRFLCGNGKLYREMCKAKDYIFKKNRYTYFNILTQDPQFSTLDFGTSVLQKEPDVKESKGGLRSIHSIIWLAGCFLGASSLKEMYIKGFIKKDERISLERSNSFMLLVRSLIHFYSDIKTDVLTLELQEKISAIYLSKTGKEGGVNIKLDVETFMKEYYSHAKNIYIKTLGIIERFSQMAEELKVIPKKKRRKFILKDYVEIQDKLYFTVKCEPDLARVLEIFLITVKTGTDYSEEIYAYIKDCLPLINEKTRADEKLFNDFRKILSSERNLYHVFELMHVSGFLKAYIPYYDKMDCMPQHDYYHSYTLDEHHFQCIKALSGLYNSSENNLRSYRNALNNIRRRDILVFCLLTHDFGKLWQGDHAENARRKLDTLVEVFPFDDEEKKLIGFLIVDHLLLSRISQRRDFTSIKTLASFADKIGTLEKLELLYVFTYADINGVGRGIFNNWKGSMISELFFKTKVLLTEAKRNEELYIKLQDEELKRIKETLIEQAEDKPLFADFVDKLSDKYLIDVDEDDILNHFKAYKNFKKGNLELVSKPKNGYYTVFTLAENISGLFSKITGIFCANGLAVLAADIYSKELAANIFYVESIYYGDVDNKKWERIKNEINLCLKGEISDIEKLINERKIYKNNKYTTKIEVKTSIKFDDNFQDLTLMEIECKDIPGLLFIVSKEITSLGFSLEYAKINTFGIRAVDTLYIKGRTSAKLSNDEKEFLKDKISDVLKGVYERNEH